MPNITEVHEKLTNAFKPIAKELEPYKVGSFNHERGVPHLHIDYNCEKMKEDPQCKHEVMRNSPMVGAGHHVRAKSNVPIIGILTQPIPS